MLAQIVHTIGYMLSNTEVGQDMDGDDTTSWQEVQENQRHAAARKSKRLERKAEKVEGKIDNKTGVTGGDEEGSRDGRAIGRELRPSNHDARKELQRQLDDARQQVEAGGREIGNMAETINVLRSKITSLMRERDIISQEARKKEEKSARSEWELGRLQQEVHNLQDDRTRSRDHGQALEQQLRRRDQEAKITQTELHEVKAQYSRTQTLLEFRTQELKGTKSFLTKADSLSGAEVIAMVEGLNSDILQTAAFTADSFAFGEVKAGAHQQRAAYEEVKQRLGHKMAQILTSARHSEDPMLEWHSDEGIRSHQILSSIYDRVRQSEDQAVSGRWRALTRNYVRTMVHVPELAMHYRRVVTECLVDILITAGYQESRQKAVEIVLSTLSDKIDVIIGASFRLNHAVGEEITSCDLGPVCAPVGIAFNPSTMDDIGGDHAPQKTMDPVLCTTEVGLQRVERQTKESRSWMETTLLLKPKVALESIVENMSR